MVKVLEGRGRRCKLGVLVANWEEKGLYRCWGVGSWQRFMYRRWWRRSWRWKWAIREGGGVGSSGPDKFIVVVVDGTREVFFRKAGVIFNPKVVGETEATARATCNTCIQRGNVPSLDFIISNARETKIVKKVRHLRTPRSTIIRLSKCEEHTTMKPMM